MSDLSRSERLDLASRVFYDFRQQASDMDPPAYEYDSDQDLMTALISDMRHYADWRGIDFDGAIAAGTAAYYQRRNEEEYPYSLGEEVETLQRRSGQDSAEDNTSPAPGESSPPFTRSVTGRKPITSGSSGNQIPGRSRATISSRHRPSPGSPPIKDPWTPSPEPSGFSWRPARGSEHANFAAHRRPDTTCHAWLGEHRDCCLVRSASQALGATPAASWKRCSAFSM